VQKYVYISIGGAIGAVLRLSVGNIHNWSDFTDIPLNTLAINIMGCFVLALFLTIAYEVMEVDADIRLGVSTGLLGSFTTFSTLCKESVELMIEGEYFSAILYIILSIALGLAAAYFGIVLARKVMAKRLKDTPKGVMEILDEGEA